MLKILVISLYSLLFCVFPVLSDSSSKVFLLKTYQNQEVVGWLMSEKLDGVRGVWDGKSLKTKNGNPIFAPQWFLKQMPPFAIDGELWTKRNDFEEIQSIVLSKTPDDRWRKITLNVFEVPNQQGGLLQRLSVLDKFLKKSNSPSIKIIPQQVVQSQQHLETTLKSIMDQSGEGLVVRKPEVSFYIGRTQDALKVKSFLDDECVLTGYKEGKGKFTGIVGSFICDWHGMQLFIGSGIKKSLRITPPPIGSKLTFKYYGKTKSGKPKFATFLRVRQKE